MYTHIPRKVGGQKLNWKCSTPRKHYPGKYSIASKPVYQGNNIQEYITLLVNLWNISSAIISYSNRNLTKSGLSFNQETLTENPEINSSWASKCISWIMSPRPSLLPHFFLPTSACYLCLCSFPSAKMARMHTTSSGNFVHTKQLLGKQWPCLPTTYLPMSPTAIFIHIQLEMWQVSTSKLTAGKVNWSNLIGLD